MAAKIILLVCAQALLIQSAFSQCAAGHTAPYGLNGGIGYNGLATTGLANAGLAGSCVTGSQAAGYAVPTNGGGFAVTSASPFAPIGLSIVSENAIEGSLSVGGNLPFLGTVALDGLLPTSGTGAVTYNCGNEAVGIVSEGPVAAGTAYSPGYPGTGYASGPGFGPGLIAPAYNGVGGSGCAAY